MEKISLLITALFLTLSFGLGVLAQEAELPAPGLTPDSAFYFLESFFEDIGTLFTFGDVAKAERYAKLAAERVAEAKAVVDKGKPEAAEKALKRYEVQLKKALAKANQARAKGKDVSEVTEIVAEATSKHFAVLDEVLERVPVEAKEAIMKAKEVSKIGQMNALKVLAGERPERAAVIALDAMKLRLDKAKREAAQGDRPELEEAIEDHEDYRELVKEMRENNKVLATLFAEDMTEQIEDLDEVEEKAIDKLPAEVINKIRAVKSGSINEQIDALRSVVMEKPEKVVEILSQAAESRLNKAKREADEGDGEEAEEAVKEYDQYASFGQEISTLAQGLKVGETTVEELVKKATSHHQDVLRDVLQKIPEEAKGAIQKAIDTTEKIRRGKPFEVPKPVVEEKPEIPEVPEPEVPEIEAPEIPEVPEVETPEVPEIPEIPHP
jgi:hypothetical protein